MKLIKEVVDRIKVSEGLRLEAYPDPGSKDGKPVTIGYGTTRIDGKPVKLGTKITKEQAEKYLNADLAVFSKKVAEGIKVKVNENQFGALVSFAYNVGLGDPTDPNAPTGFLTSTLLRKLNAGDYASVPSELRRWNRNDGKVMQGLINRREDEIKLWNTPVKSTEKPVETVKEVVVDDGRENILIVLIKLLIKLFARK